MIQFGNDKIKEIYVGSDKIKEVYHGSVLVWSGKKPSYAILTDDTRIDFELENTPMSGLEVPIFQTSIILNGTSYPNTTIKEITFGNSYGNVTSIGNYFLRDCSNFTSLDLSVFSNVTSIGTNFLRDCSKLTQLKIGAINVPQTETIRFLDSTSSLTTILVPIQSVSAYKTTAPWSSHASKITGY